MQGIQNIAKALRRNLSLLFVGGLLLVTITLIVLSYYDQLDLAETQILQRLQGIASSLAPQISGDEHRNLFRKFTRKDAISSSQQDPAYLKIHNLLQQAQLANRIETPIYTMVLRPRSEREGDSPKNAVVFGVTSATKPYFRHVYTPPRLLLDHYNTGGVVPPYGDVHGAWLSAFAPIKDSDGLVVAVVQVDMKFNSFVTTARKRLYRNLLIALGIFAFFSLVMVRVLFVVTRALRFHDSVQQENELFQEEVMVYSQEMQKTLEQLTTLVDNLLDGVILLDRDGTILHINPQFLNSFGVHPENMIGQHYGTVFGEEIKHLLDQARIHKHQNIQQEIVLPNETKAQVFAAVLLESSKEQTDSRRLPPVIGMMFVVRSIETMG